MFLGVPAGKMADIIPRERNRTIVIVVRPAKWAEQLFPLRGTVELVSVVEGVPCFVAEIHHDLAWLFEIIVLLFQLGKTRVRQIKRNANHGLARRATPLVRQITGWMKFLEFFAVQFAIQLLHKTLQRRALDLQAQLADRLFEDLLSTRVSFFCILHAISPGNSRIRHEQTSESNKQSATTATIAESAGAFEDYEGHRHSGIRDCVGDLQPPLFGVLLQLVERSQNFLTVLVGIDVGKAACDAALGPNNEGMP
jgi:hypothetical protein